MSSLQTTSRPLIILLSLLAAAACAPAARAEGAAPADTGTREALRQEIRTDADRAVEDTREQVAGELALRLLGGRLRDRLVAGSPDGTRG